MKRSRSIQATFNQMENSIDYRVRRKLVTWPWVGSLTGIRHCWANGYGGTTRISFLMGCSYSEQVPASWKSLGSSECLAFLTPYPWKGISQILPCFLPSTKLSLGSGNMIRFWADPWVSSSPMSSRFPWLSNLFD